MAEFDLYYLPDPEERALLVVKNFALRFLAQGREGWDIPHSGSVEFYGRVFLAEEYRNNPRSNVDGLVVLAATWMHDTGYHKLFGQVGDSKNYDKVQDQKGDHMANGTGNVTLLFEVHPELKEVFSTKQQDKLRELVGVHDNVSALKTREEIILGQADTLGALDSDRVTPTFGPEGARDYLKKSIDGKRAVLFKTKFEQQLLTETRAKFERYFEGKI